MSLSPSHTLVGLTSAILIPLLACGPEIGDLDRGLLEHPIINGSPDPHHPAVGLLVLESSGTTSHCTATLIGSQTLLTAAHCINESGRYTFRLNGREILVENRVWHQDFSKSGNIPGYSNAYLNDVGLATLTEEVNEVPPVLLTYPQPTKGARIKVVGLGMTTPGDQQTIGERQLTTSTIGTTGEAHYIFGMKVDANGGNPCYGDSGGPTFVELFGRDHLLGIHSMGDEACSAYGYDMDVSAYASWITSKAGANLGVSGIDSDPPLIMISSPADGAVVPASFSVEVVALDDRSGLEKIELLLDRAHYGVSSASPASFALEGLSAGPHLLSVRATDRIGRSAEASLEIAVDPAASVDPEPPWAGLNDRIDNDDHRIEIIGSCAVGSPTDSAGLLTSMLILYGLLAALGRRRRQRSRLDSGGPHRRSR